MFSINSASSGQGQGAKGAGSSSSSSSGRGPNSSQQQGGGSSATHSQASTGTPGGSSSSSHGAGSASTVVVVMPSVSQPSGGANAAAPGSPASPPAPSASTPRCSKLDLAGAAREGEEESGCGLAQRLVANAWMHLAPTAAAGTGSWAPVAPPAPKGSSTAVAAARRLQRWVRRLQAEAQQAARARWALPGHVGPLAEAAAALGAGSWGCEWEALCSEENGLPAHAQGLLAGLGLPTGGEDVLSSLMQPEVVLSALLIAAHPEVVTAHMARRAKRSLRHRYRHHSRRSSTTSSTTSSSSTSTSSEGETALEQEQRRRRRRRQARVHARKGEALAAGAVKVRDSLLALERALSLDCAEDPVPCWAMARVSQQAAHAVAAFAVRREHCRGAAAAETARLADELTGAAAEVLEAMGRTGAHEEAAKLGELEQALTRLVGSEEALARLDAARAAAQARLQHGDECAAAAAAVASAMEVESVVQEPQQQQPSSVAVEAAGAAAAAAAAAAGAGCPESLFSNEWLIHEICVLPPGRFLQVSLEDTSGSGSSSGAAGGAYTVHAMGGGAATANAAAAATSADAEAYWASVTRTLLAGDATPLLVLVQELAERLISITPSRADLAAEVTEALDVALLEQVLARDLLDSRLLFSMLRFAGERILWLEAPARNESTQAWLAQLADLEARVLGRARGGAVRLSLGKGSGSGSMEQQQHTAVAGEAEWAPLVSPLFEFLLEKVDQIHIDIFNSHVRRATPHWRADGTAFERQRFEERLSAGQASVARTKEWLAGVLASEWCAGQALPVPGSLGKHQHQQQEQQVSLAEGLKANREDALKRLLRRAYATLALPDPESQPSVSQSQSSVAPPEPLAMDAHRLQLARHGLLCISRAAACCAYLSQTLGRPLTAAERGEALKELMVLLPVEEGEEGGDVVAEGVSLQVGALARRFFSFNSSRSSSNAVQPGHEQLLQPQQQQQQQPAVFALEARVARMLATGDCPVLRLLCQRGVDALHAALQQDGAPPAQTQAQAQASSEGQGQGKEGLLERECRVRGLGGLEPWVRKVAEVLLLVCRHNEAAFGPLYHALAVEVLREAEAEAAAAATMAMDVAMA
jgi:hypothetical protein